MAVLVTLTPAAGSSIRLSTEAPTAPTTADGVELYATPCTVSDLRAALSWSPDLGARSLTITAQADLRDLLAAGARVEVALWSPSIPWPDRQVVLVGVVTDASTSPIGATFTATEDPAADFGQLLDGGAAVSARTWPRTDAQRLADGWYAASSPLGTSPAAVGLAYPTIIGRPSSQIPLRVLGSLTEYTAPGSPALYVERSASTTDPRDHVFVVAGHAVEASHVTWGDPTTRPLTLHREPVTHQRDAQGRRVATICPGGSGSIPADDSPEAWAYWTDGGGLYEGGRLIRSAPDVIAWALRRSSVRVDWQRLAALAPLASILLDTAIWEQAAPLDWLRSQVLPLLPVGAASGPGGLYWYPLLPDAPPVTTLLDGHGCYWGGGVEIDHGDILTRIVVEYAIGGQSGRPHRRVTLTGWTDPYEADDPDVLVDPWAALATRAAGRRSEVITAATVCDTSSAVQIGRHLLRLRSQPRRTLTVTADPDLVAHLAPGDRVDVQGPDVVATCIVSAVSIGAALTTLSLRWLPPAHHLAP